MELGLQSKERDLGLKPKLLGQGVSLLSKTA